LDIPAFFLSFRFFSVISVSSYGRLILDVHGTSFHSFLLFFLLSLLSLCVVSLISFVFSLFSRNEYRVITSYIYILLFLSVSSLIRVFHLVSHVLSIHVFVVSFFPFLVACFPLFIRLALCFVQKIARLSFVCWLNCALFFFFFPLSFSLYVFFLRLRILVAVLCMYSIDCFVIFFSSHPT
jgi:hypothetical protein